VSKTGCSDIYELLSKVAYLLFDLKAGIESFNKTMNIVSLISMAANDETMFNSSLKSASV